MSDEKALVEIHPKGERPAAEMQPLETVTSVDTFAGKIQVKWVPEATVSSLGLMPFFIEFLKTSGRFDAWVEECPLQYTSPNAPRKRDVLGTILLSVLSGHWRYAHMNAIRGDGVNPELLGMTKVASEDSVRRALIGIQEEDSGQWMKRHLRASYEPLLEEPWALDVDSTVKPLYGHQEDAKLGYNPSKPGRPSHVYHSYFIANLRWCWRWKYKRGIRPPRRLRSRSCGRCWTDWRRRVVRHFCAGTAIGERSGPWKEPSSAR